MVAYEFYLPDQVKGDELVGILPERRKEPSRITQKSIMGWVEKVFGSNLRIKDIYFIEVTINEYSGMISRPTPAFIKVYFLR
jgi:hypothetical protein